MAFTEIEIAEHMNVLKVPSGPEAIRPCRGLIRLPSWPCSG
jgi:hypothetical protein